MLLILALCYPIDSWQNEVLEEIQVRGKFITNTPGIRPYFLKDEEFLNPQNDSFDRKEADIIGMLCECLWLPNMSITGKFDTVKVCRLKPMVRHDFSKFSLYLQPDVKFGTDSLPPNRVFKNLFSADYERVYARYKDNNFGLFIGRERFSLGPSPRYNILLSGYGPPMDWFHYELKAKLVNLVYYLSRLDDMTCKPIEYIGDTITTKINARRYLIIKRLDFTPYKWFNCSFSEVAIFGGENYALLPYHFNPIVFIHTLQHNWDFAANLFFHLDARILLKNFSIYSALLIDDYQLEPDPNGEPNHYGINLGVELADFVIPNSFLMIEYSFLSPWIYCIYAPYQRYMYCGHPIGFPYGPDCDELHSKLIHHLKSNLDIFFSISYLRKGENSVNSTWPIPEEPRVPGTPFPKDNFLFGTFEKTFNIKLGFRLFYRKNFFSEISLGYLNIGNYRHVINKSKNAPQLNFAVNLISL